MPSAPQYVLLEPIIVYVLQRCAILPCGRRPTPQRSSQPIASPRPEEDRAVWFPIRPGGSSANPAQPAVGIPRRSANQTIGMGVLSAMDSLFRHRRDWLKTKTNPKMELWIGWIALYME
jgi:hypothetical protein